MPAVLNVVATGNGAGTKNTNAWNSHEAYVESISMYEYPYLMRDGGQVCNGVNFNSSERLK